MSRLIYRGLGLCAILIGLALGSGCASAPNKTGSPRLASIISTNHTPEQIDKATEKVLGSHGYALKKRLEAKLVFEKPGTFMNNLAYGDWYGGGIWDRIAVYQKPLERDQILVDCDAWMVQEPDDPFFQKARPMGNGRRSYYQGLLDEVSHELDPPAKSK